ncbi:MAG: peroxidase family protein, partial [Saprospiraceae bacterium]|nr:peroxidase family protein [Saprospiraceae bacterium]
MDVNLYPFWCILVGIWLAIPTLDAQVRSYDGYGNNESFPHYGAVHAPLRVVTPSAFSDSISEPNGLLRPNPREISNQVFAQADYIFDEHELSDYTWVFGQFIDHDISLVDDSETETAFVVVPPCDVVFDPMCQTATIIPMMRSAPVDGSGTSRNNPRLYSNAISAFIDGSAIYGSDAERADWLRTFEGGRLKTSSGNLLPFNTLDGELEGVIDENAPKMASANVTTKR